MLVGTMNKDLPSLKSKFPPLLHLTYVLQQSSDELLLSEVGTSLSHARIMSGLSAVVTRSQHQLALELRQTEANISRQLQVMKRAGLVNIAKNKKDGRQRDVKLSAKGARKYAKAEALLKKQQKHFQKILNSYEGQAITDFSKLL